MTNYDELAAWAESDAPTIRPDAVVRQGTPASHAAVRALLTEAADTSADVETIARSVGRPTLAVKRPAGSSPLWQIRAPQALDEQMRARAAAEGRPFSEVLRDAAAEYLIAHH